MRSGYLHPGDASRMSRRPDRVSDSLPGPTHVVASRRCRVPAAFPLNCGQRERLTLREGDRWPDCGFGLTSTDVDDAAPLGPLLVWVAGSLISFTGDGAYDQDGVYADVAERHPDAAVIAPPRGTAMLSERPQWRRHSATAISIASLRGAAWLGRKPPTTGAPGWRRPSGDGTGDRR
jgi:hypothetical protein